MTEPERRSLRAELRAAVTPRAFLLVLGVFVLQLGFILSYAGAFHQPTPHRIALGVVAPQGAGQAAAQQVASRLNALPDEPLHADVVADRAAAVTQIKDRDLDGALIIGTGNGDELLVASAEGGSLSSALEQVVTRADAAQRRTVTVHDVVPANPGDARGLTAFYLAVGWVVGGYLVASILAISAGSLPANLARAGIRLGSLAVYSVLSGLGGAIVVGPALGVYDGSVGSLTWFGALVVFGVGAFTMAIQSLTGVVGIGIAVLLFVILGNPSAGGAYPAPLLPPFWHAIGPWLPPGAGTEGIRNLVYFDGAKLGMPVGVSVGYCVVGAVALAAVAAWRSRRAASANSAPA